MSCPRNSPICFSTHFGSFDDPVGQLTHGEGSDKTLEYWIVGADGKCMRSATLTYLSLARCKHWSESTGRLSTVIPLLMSEARQTSLPSVELRLPKATQWKLTMWVFAQCKSHSPLFHAQVRFNAGT